MAIMGAPKKEFDWEQFDLLCSFPEVVTQSDISSVMKVSVDTCADKIRAAHNMTFSEYRTQKQGGFRSRLLKAQYEVAIKKQNVAMLIWLGKNYLNQREPKLDISMEVKDDDKIAREYAAQLKAMGFVAAQNLVKDDDSGNKPTS
jgi:hypothetical protein